MLIALNFSDQERLVTLPTLGGGRIATSTYLDREEEIDLKELVLRGDEGVIVALA